MFNIKLEEMSHKMSFKALPVKIQQSKNRQGGRGHNVPLSPRAVRVNKNANNSRSKQNKKSPTHPFVDIGKYETCAKFQKKILSCSIVETPQSFQIFRQNTWFLKNNRALSKFLYGILHSLISTIKLYQNQYIKKQFYINHASHLNKKNKF